MNKKLATIVIIVCLAIVHTINVSHSQWRVNSGRVAGALVGSTTAYYMHDGLTDLTTYYQEYDFGFYSMTVQILNDSTNYIEWSWAGTHTKGKLSANEEDTLDFIMMDDIWLRGEKGLESFRVIVW